jgi:hypothetical protein
MNPSDVVINLNLNLDQINLIITSLGKLPYDSVAELIALTRKAALDALMIAENKAKDDALLQQSGAIEPEA